jgi:hypothetical protein
LVIFDHLNSTTVDHQNLSFQIMIPFIGGGHVVFTSRDRTLEAQFQVRPFRLSDLGLHSISMQGSLELIFTRLAIPMPNVEEEKGAMKIFEGTDGFPLFLHRIISLLQEQKMPLWAPGLGAWMADQFTPFFSSISQDLADELSFLRILSFWSQRIPMAMILLSERQLDAFGMWDIKDSIRALMRKGWLEGVRNPAPIDSRRFQSGHAKAFSRAHRSDFPDIQFDRGVQQVVCNDTKQLDRQGRPRDITIGGAFDVSWIDTSALILCGSFQKAQADTVESGAELDAYEIHVRTLRAHYPAEPNSWMKEASRLDECIRFIELEREKRNWEVSHGDEQMSESETRLPSIFTEEASNLVLPHPISRSPSPTPDTTNRLGWKVGDLFKPKSKASGPVHLRRYSDDPIFQQSVETGSDMEATSSSSTKRSTALKAIFQGTNLGTPGQSARLPSTVVHSGGLRPSPSLLTARSSSPASSIHSPLTTLNRSVSETVARGEVAWSHNTPATSSTGNAYSALLHNLAAERKREGKQPARHPSFSGSDYSGG